MEGTGKMLDYTAHMYSSQEHTLVRGRPAKEDAPHPLWLMLLVTASALTLAYARAAGHRGDAAFGRRRSGGALPQTPEQNTV